MTSLVVIKSIKRLKIDNENLFIQVFIIIAIIRKMYNIFIFWYIFSIQDNIFLVFKYF